MGLERCGCCRRYVPERELEPSSVYGFVCEDCFWDNKRYQREEEEEYERYDKAYEEHLEKEHEEWLREQEK